jgi:hydrogenase nickel incorporation protein HypB
VETRVDADPDGTIHVHVQISGRCGPTGPVHRPRLEGGTRHDHAHGPTDEHRHDGEPAPDPTPAHDPYNRVSEPFGAPLAPARAAGGPRRIELEARVLERNDRQARLNREWLDARGVAAINLISSPGSGKTLLLERTLEALGGTLGCAVITGDQNTDHDARRLAGKGAAVVQIQTHSACHLNAEQVAAHLQALVTPGVRLLIIENVGNLVCPAAFDLGEHHKIALLSVTEGEDKPLKYPALFHDAPVCVLTKVDLLPHLDFDLDSCRRAVRSVRPDAVLFELSARTGVGMKAWVEYLHQLAGSTP